MTHFQNLLTGSILCDFGETTIEGKWRYQHGADLDFDCIQISMYDASTEAIQQINGKLPISYTIRGSNAGSWEQTTHLFIDKRVQWLTWWLRLLKQDSASQLTLILLHPSKSGFILRNDIIQKRLVACRAVKHIWTDLDTGKRLTGRSPSIDELIEDPRSFFESTFCGIILQNTGSEFERSISDLLVQRLSLPLFVNVNLERKKIALVEGGFNLEFRKDFFDAVTGLGIDLVVLDDAGHWLKRTEFDHLIEDFLTIDLKIDDQLPQKIAKALQGSNHMVDGIITLSDKYLCPTAMAARILGLPTSPADAFNACVEKHLTRDLVPFPEIPSFMTPKSDDDHQYSDSGYPMILKPSQGAGSLAVYLVRNETERSQAIERIEKIGKKVVTERYIDGPEVDINIVLHDGEVTFWEVSDDLPCTAEGFPTQFPATSWTETGVIFPSGLERHEIELLKERTVEVLLRLGFRWGVFHCEARVQSSSSEYKFGDHGWPHLEQVQIDRDLHPEIAIIDLNARPPGFSFSAGSGYAYGVDYFALTLMAAVRDSERFRALSVPFSNLSTVWWECAFIPIEKGGVFRQVAMFDELLNTSSELMRHVVRWVTFFQDGDIVKDPKLTGKTLWAVWFVVSSTESREHLEELVAAVREKLQFDVL